MQKLFSNNFHHRRTFISNKFLVPLATSHRSLVRIDVKLSKTEKTILGKYFAS